MPAAGTAPAGISSQKGKTSKMKTETLYLNAKRQFLQAESTMAKTDSNDSPHSWKLHNILTKILADGTVEIASTDINNDKDAAIVQATVNGIMSHHAALTSKNVSDSEAVQLIKALASEIQEQKNRPPEGIAEITLKEAVNKCIQAKGEGKNKLTAKKYNTVLSLMLDVLGEDMPVWKIRKPEALKLKGIVSMLPKNMGKYQKLANLPIEKAVKIAKKDGMQTVSISTQADYITVAGGFMTWAATQGFAIQNANPFTGLAPEDNRDKEAIKERFSKEDLIKIFCPERHNLKTHKQNPARYWIPWLALYTGARLNEICSLYLKDIQREGGIHLLTIVQDAEGKSQKTKAAKRAIPIHSKLISLGFLDYIEALRTKGKQRLFPELTLTKAGYSGAIGKWFNRVLKKQLGITGNKSFHSFRHNVAFELVRQHGDTDWKVKHLLGHARAGETGGRYAGKPALSDLQAIMETLDYGLPF